MSRYNRRREVDKIYDAVEEWRTKSLIANQSIFGDKKDLWRKPELNHLKRLFKDKPDNRKKVNFLTKLERQLSGGPPSCKKLMAEILWLLFLFPISSNIGPARKREVIREVWSWSRNELDASHRLFEESLLMGVGSSGTAFNTQRWRELIFFIDALLDFKSKSTADREKIVLDPWKFSTWLNSITGAGPRQFTHILPHLMFPSNFENSSMLLHKQQMLTGFDYAPGEDYRKWRITDIDQALLDLRRSLEPKFGVEFDFYQKGIVSKWQGSKKKTVKKTAGGNVNVQNVLSDRSSPFEVILHDETGRELDAKVIEEQFDDFTGYTLESRGGSPASGNVRNPDYIPALKSLLRRFKETNTVIQDILVTSRELDDFPLSEKSVQLTDDFPIYLDDETDINELRLDISRSMAVVGSKRTAKHGGNPTRRICIITSSPHASLLTTLSASQSGDKPASSNGITGPPPTTSRKASQRQQLPGNVYVAKLIGLKDNVLKIGCSNDPIRRMHELNRPLHFGLTGLKWELCGTLPFPTERKAWRHEQEVHRNLKSYLVKGEREIYREAARDTKSFHSLIVAHSGEGK